MSPFERRVRNLINPYSTAFARWWCHSGCYLIPGSRRAAGRRRPGRPRPVANLGIPNAVIRRSSADYRLAVQAARRAAVDELLASLDDGGAKAPDRG
jgi:hypothetical protein